MKKSIRFTMTANEFFALKEYGGQRLSNGDKIVYQVLCSHLYGKKYCYPSIKTIASESALAVRSVQRSLSRLQTAGLITVTTRQENGTDKSNCYYVKNIFEENSDGNGSDLGKCQEGATKCPSKKNKNTNTTIFSTLSTTKKTKVERVDDTTKNQYADDIRFKIIENDKGLQAEMKPEAYYLVKKYFITISHTKKENYVIDGMSIPDSDVQECLQKLSYRDIVNIAGKVGAMMNRKDFNIRAEYGYFLKVFWTYRSGHESPKEKKNFFRQFPQRNYFSGEISDLEKRLLTKNIT